MDDQILRDFYNQYGVVQAVGLTKLNQYYEVVADGEHAYVIYFTRLHKGIKLKNIPNVYEDVKVLIEISGVIRPAVKKAGEQLIEDVRRTYGQFGKIHNVLTGDGIIVLYNELYLGVNPEDVPATFQGKDVKFRLIGPVGPLTLH